MEEFLLDSGVVHALVNKEDEHHGICFKFFKEHKDDKFHIPQHGYFEIQSSISKRKKAGTFTGYEKNIRLNFNKVVTGAKFHQECKGKNLFSLFDSLKGGDLIFACIAKLRGYALVTCDRDFEKYGTEINVIYLPELNSS